MRLTDHQGAFTGTNRLVSIMTRTQTASETRAKLLDAARDLAAAKARYAPNASWDPESVGYFMQCVLQGAFIFAKAKQSAEIAAASLGHLRNYLESLLGHPENEQGVAV